MQNTDMGVRLRHCIYRDSKDRNEKTDLLELRASVTVEASLCIPVFFVILFSIFYEFNILSGVNKNHIRLADAASDYAVYGMKSDTLISALEGGHIIMWSESNGYKICFMKYKTKIPFVTGALTRQRFYQRMVVSGYEGKSMCSEAKKSDDKVYITEKGRVYHVYPDCTYLNPSVQRILAKEIDKKRNSSGAKYRQCEFCFKSNNDMKTYVYITNYGDRYHLIKKCHGIKRNIRKVRLSEIGGMSECNKCRERG
ncbi:hypothetical protein KQI69_03670 [Eubacterium sp. MSJ-13]|uniref:TadE/TadG family type IV pilus assembly protein n=1 Tax=Eubacterium sp. MSJ-13 TaxID=2841513 RepID=UPI001C112447|nr:hypothetical protein [Eubacterium sp. MSJ-13]MBU5478298.1 hypothetical protein [Eubacterium sp. MSJ-13]